MSRIIKPLMVSIFFAGSLLSATIQAAPRAVDANNGVVLKLQALVKDITTERDLLKTEKDKLAIDIEKLKKDNAASVSESDRLSSEVSAQKSSNDAVRGTLEQTHAKLLEVIEKYNVLNQVKNELSATHVNLQNSHKQTEAELQSCEGKNIKLFEAGKEVLNSYEDIGVIDTLFKSEPVLQFKSVEMQTIAQEYEDKLRKQKYQHKELMTPNVITPVTKETKQP
ncbi:hypothetical protein [Methylobacter psychrophilus]|uniref:hypothetical protein n=1 Tax=Methylobacter psychrophilus TaxID=96941 RepID=UPI0021D4CF3F|nr:hypothetical protein [Methylobacter psychrophilus]